MQAEQILTLYKICWKRGDTPILKEISWDIHSGEHWCLLGLNGSGKSTILQLLNGYLWPTSGEIEVLGKKFGTYDLRQLRKEIGLVSSSLQQQLRGSDTAIDIVLSGKHASLSLYEPTIQGEVEQAKALLEQFGCTHLQHRTYQVLSQGERQRILLARALMASPRLLILDEPTTGLDFIAREQLLQYVDTLTKQPNAPTIIYVTHHIEEILPCFTHTLLLKDGSIFDSGRTNDMLVPELLSRFFGNPVQLEHIMGRHWLFCQGPVGKRL
ncbi:ABC transporter ATP-binding protein [Brevibacillus laterosporus]|uniref:ABC transporter ATP-binding protein n=1 Tax=Brevibacillus laterosporus TaxID=1465 RepID=UPI000B9BF175|nr:ABC transporter ATP-binding protein [Brevibacillus laterosporus]